ncbi:MAG: hypothetical protein ACUVUP_02495 [Thermaceae bacterium]
MDFWRMEAVEPPKLLRLRPEMSLPGRTWPQRQTLPEEGGIRLVQTAYLGSKGLLGFLY